MLTRSGHATTSTHADIGDYAFISDGHSSALVCRSGSIDWLCMPRMDSPSVFGKLLDIDDGGSFHIWPTSPHVEQERSYIDHTLVLETILTTSEGRIRIRDCFAMREGGRVDPYRQLLRVVECIEGSVEVDICIEPKLEYGRLRPWIRRHAPGVFTAVGGASGLVFSGDDVLHRNGRHVLSGRQALEHGQKIRLSMQWGEPEFLDGGPSEAPDGDQIEERLDETVDWWERWVAQSDGGIDDGVIRSATVLKGLVNAPTGAMIAAPTTSLPEEIGGCRNWDYRFSWVRDSVFMARSLIDIGFRAEADGFRRFVERSAAGSASELQVVYGIGGERRLDEFEIDLEGYRGSRPVRVGNGAYTQNQLDVYGYVLDLAWMWVAHGEKPDDEYWEFISDAADTVVHRWRMPDQGLWELRLEPRAVVHSKVMCWAALDRAVRLAERFRPDAPSLDRWRSERDVIRSEVLTRGVDRARSCFTQSYQDGSADAALLLIPSVGFVDWKDDLVTGTIEAVRNELEVAPGRILRYRNGDGLNGREGAFVACGFWLAEALARNGQTSEARDEFDAARATGNDLGLFSEEVDPTSDVLLGNFPQGLSHLAHISAAVALDEAEQGA
jgi:GH15 family glucan-1,4-alpha-glucosidase